MIEAEKVKERTILETLVQIVGEQAEDKDLWSIAGTASEQRLWGALRKLHAVVKDDCIEDGPKKMDEIKMACAEMYDLCDWDTMEPGTEEKYCEIIIKNLIDCKPAYDKMMTNIDKLMDSNPEPDSQNGKLLNHLAILIENYEANPIRANS